MKILHAANNKTLLRSALILGAAIGVSACSSIVDGTSQEIAIATSPGGANCALEREGLTIARVNPTPGVATVQKTKHDITIKCTKETFHEAVYLNNSGVAAATFGNLILGGGVGWIIDSASGADNKYTSPVNITLVPLSQPKPAPILSPKPGEEMKDGKDKPTS